MLPGRPGPWALLGPVTRLGVDLGAKTENGPRTESFAKRWASHAARSRTAVGILLAGWACWAARPTSESVLLGVPIALFGLAIRTWAAGHLRKNQELAVSGPYSYVRNPLYIGSLLAGVGLSWASNHLILLVAVVAVFLFWFLPVVREEEDHIRKILPGYTEYESRVRRFVPHLRPRYNSATGFSFRLFVVNREHAALGGFLIFVLVLWLKLRLL